MRTVSSAWVCTGRRPAFIAPSMNLALTPNSVTPQSSATSKSRAGLGWKGDPSYSTSDAPLASPATSQFHIIQPVVVKYMTRSPGRTSKCSRCSLHSFSSAPPAR